MRKTPKQAEEQHREEAGYQKASRQTSMVERETNIYDEHPEIPRVRRASLHQHKEQPQEKQGAIKPKRPQEHKNVEAIELKRPQEPNRTEVADPRKTRQLPRVTAAQLAAPRKAPVARRRPLPTTIQQTPHGRNIRVHLHKRHSEQTFFSQFQLLLRDRNVLIIASIIFAFFICMPILSSLAKGSPSTSQSVSVPGSGAPGNTGTTATSPAKNELGPKNPHEVVILPPKNVHPAPPVYAKAAYLLDVKTGMALYARNPFTHLPVMSTTKLMTAILVTEKGNLDRKVTINNALDHDLQTQLSPDSSLMHIKKGETYTVRDLLHGLMLVSGNDAAIILADISSGSVKNFVAEMNNRAKVWGLRDTHFQNPHGLLDSGHYSSARDMALVGMHSMQNKTLSQIMSTREYTIPATKEHPRRVLSNGNQFLWWYPGANGGKTGWDAATNFVQVISVQRGDTHLIGVVIYTRDWWTDMRNLMNYGFNNYQWLSPRELYEDDTFIPFAVDWNYFSRDKRENSIPMGKDGRYYNYTGYSITSPFTVYFDKNNGLKKFGFPISQPRVSGETTLSQRFERGTIQCDLKTKKCTS